MVPLQLTCLLQVSHRLLIYSLMSQSERHDLSCSFSNAGQGDGCSEGIAGHQETHSGNTWVGRAERLKAKRMPEAGKAEGPGVSLEIWWCLSWILKHMQVFHLFWLQLLDLIKEPLPLKSWGRGGVLKVKNFKTQDYFFNFIKNIFQNYMPIFLTPNFI